MNLNLSRCGVNEGVAMLVMNLAVAMCPVSPRPIKSIIRGPIAQAWRKALKEWCNSFVKDDPEWVEGTDGAPDNRKTNSLGNDDVSNKTQYGVDSMKPNQAKCNETVCRHLLLWRSA